MLRWLYFLDNRQKIDKDGLVTESLTVNSEMHAVDVVDQWVEHLAREWRIPNATRFAIKLCCEESFLNIVLHGVGRRHAHVTAAEKSVRLVMTHLDHHIDLTVEDHGDAFDPLTVETPRRASAMSAGIGGNGIHLMRRFSKQMSYLRRDNINQLTLRFSLPEATPASRYPADRLHEHGSTSPRSPTAR
jgi:serine/threonine-protein kinase RsbW